MNDSGVELLEKLFLQAVISHGALREDKMEELYAETMAACEVSCLLPLPNFLRKINLSLKSLGMKVGTAKMEDCHEDWYALVNTVPDAAAKVGSKFTANQLEFFNKIVKYLVLEEGVVSSTYLLNVTSELERKLSLDDAEKFIKTLIKQKWLKEESGKISAGPRFILELRPFMSEIYGERVPYCKICREPVIQGQSCDNCDVKIHLLCVAMLAKGRKEVKCPGCHDPWPHNIPDIFLPCTENRNGQDSAGPQESSRAWEKSSKNKKSKKHK